MLISFRPRRWNRFVAIIKKLEEWKTPDVGGCKRIILGFLFAGLCSVLPWLDFSKYRKSVFSKYCLIRETIYGIIPSISFHKRSVNYGPFLVLDSQRAFVDFEAFNIVCLIWSRWLYCNACVSWSDTIRAFIFFDQTIFYPLTLALKISPLPLRLD